MPRKATPAKPRSLPASKSKSKQRGCLGRLALTALALFGLCIGVSIVWAGIQSAGEAVGLLPTRTPTHTPTITPTPSPTATATETPVPTNTPVPTETPLPSATPTVTDTPAPTLTPPPTRTPFPTATSAPTATPTTTPTVLVVAQRIESVTVDAPDDNSAITVVTWNIGLDDADLTVIADRMAAFEGVDLWALQETNAAAGAALEAAAEAGENADFSRHLGASGNDLRLLSLYNADRFELIDAWEEDSINTTGNARAPLVLALKDRQTGVIFYFMNNHLYRSRDDERHKQAQLLKSWGEGGSLPVIAAGDYNFDWDDNRGAVDHDLGYDLMTADGAWQWVKPATIVPTQCTDSLPCTYDDVLDFIVTAGPAQGWRAESEIVVAPGDFPDDARKSDHRPVMASFWPELPAEGQFAVAPSTTTAAAAGTVANANANLRSGPGTEYALAGSTQAGQPLIVVGWTSDGSWLQLESGLWVAAWLVDGVAGDLAVVAAPTLAIEDRSVDAVVDAPAEPADPTPAGASGSNPWPDYTCEENPSPPPDAACPIKGNISSGGHIYHTPGQRDYCKTVIDPNKGERWFCSAADAEAAGWRAAKR